MSFKNALKLLLSKYRLFWVILLFLLAVFVVLASLSVSFAINIYRALEAAGIGGYLGEFVRFMLGGNGLGQTVEKLGELTARIARLFSTDPILRANSTLWIILVLTVVYRFLLGLYELPLIRVLRGALRENGRYGFVASLFPHFGKVCLFSLLKMAVMTLYDAAMGVVLYYLVRLVLLTGLTLLVPFVFALAFLCLLVLRFGLISGWAPAVLEEKMNPFRALGYSVRQFFGAFGPLFSLFAVVWILMIAINALVGVFTFGAGLVVTVPLFMLFINCLNIVFYYNHHTKRYYIEGKIFDPADAGAAGSSVPEPGAEAAKAPKTAEAAEGSAAGEENGHEQ
ncbi:MAG: hypothetical protein LBH24_05120 [Clostridiales bacterium]|jgi:hypothetical protein|nr:hypothetical protein [Clostridiales bacterium]